jgi:hypothetical protein
MGTLLLPAAKAGLQLGNGKCRSSQQPFSNLFGIAQALL